MKECFDITGMSCAACQVRVEKSVSKLDGVNAVNVNLLKNTMDVEYDDKVLSEESIVSAVEKAGYGASARKEKTAAADKEKSVDVAAEEYRKMKKIGRAHV